MVCWRIGKCMLVLSVISLLILTGCTNLSKPTGEALKGGEGPPSIDPPGGSIPPTDPPGEEILCFTDADCEKRFGKEPPLFCVENRCVSCRYDYDCPEGSLCKGGECISKADPPQDGKSCTCPDGSRYCRNKECDSPYLEGVEGLCICNECRTTTTTMEPECCPATAAQDCVAELECGPASCSGWPTYMCRYEGEFCVNSDTCSQGERCENNCCVPVGKSCFEQNVPACSNGACSLGEVCVITFTPYTNKQQCECVKDADTGVPCLQTALSGSCSQFGVCPDGPDGQKRACAGSGWSGVNAGCHCVNI